jgi:hypothetical protein
VPGSGVGVKVGVCVGVGEGVGVSVGVGVEVLVGVEVKVGVDVENKEDKSGKRLLVLPSEGFFSFPGLLEGYSMLEKRPASFVLCQGDSREIFA